MAAGKKKARKTPGKGRKKTRLRKFLDFLRFFSIFVIAPVVLGAAIGGFMAFARGVPSIAELRHDITPPSTRIFADDDTLIGEFKVQKGRYFSLKKMPTELLDAVVAIEDDRFWTHGGVDYLAIVRAALKDIWKRDFKQGGSTITQQLAKMTFLTPEKTFKRKLKEFVLARRIESNLTKEEILELYLNRAYFGHGAYGVEMAARTYFGKSVREISLPEAALIAGLLKAPNTYSPIRNFSRAKTRQSIVLRRMEDERYLSRKEREETEQTPVVLAKSAGGDQSVNYFLEYVKRHLLEKYGSETVYRGGLRVYTTLDRRAQARAQRAVQKGLRDFDKRRGFRGPTEHRELTETPEGTEKVFTMEPPSVGDILEGVVLTVDETSAVVQTAPITGTLSVEKASWARIRPGPSPDEPQEIADFDLTRILQPGDVILVGVRSLAGEHATFALEQEPEVQGALVAIEPYSGYIRALVGGYDFTKSEYNRALRAQRQAGSAFKPIIYGLALDHGFTPATVVMDEPVTYDEEDEEALEAKEKKKAEKELPEECEEGEECEEEVEPWTPQNYDEKYHGPTRLRDALAFSRNVITVKVVDAIGINRVVKFARQVGLTCELPRDLTISLGTMSITPMELTTAYGVFANNGMRMDPIGIKYVTDRRGRLLESNEPRGTRVVDERTAFLLTTMLKDVVNYGTGWRARALRVPTAGKTGTTNDYMDAWFLGYTTDMVTGVWVGYDEPRPLGPEETGSRAAAPIWVDFMKTVTNRTDPRDFPMPEGIVTRLIDPETGLLANMWTKNAVVEYFKEGTEPKDSSHSIWRLDNQDNFDF
jgi:penicillin-binding protein 1A